MIYLPKGSIMRWIDPVDPATLYYPTEHNRAALSVDVEQIGNKNRMVNGTLRKWHVADKRTWSTSWSNVPHLSQFTVDGKMGGEAMEDFYYSHPGAFTLEIIDGGGVVTSVLAMFSEFSKTVNKRGKYDMWDVNISIEEC